MSTDASPESSESMSEADGGGSRERLKLENLTRDDVEGMYDENHLARFAEWAGITDSEEATRFFRSAKRTAWRLGKDLREAERSTIAAQRRDLMPLQKALSIVNKARSNQSSKVKHGIIHIAVLEEQVKLGKAD